MRLTHAIGRYIFIETVKVRQQASINTSSMPAGLYLITAQRGDGTTGTRKVVVER